MIYTVTLNPSIDYVVDVENFKLGQVNRATKETMFPGGKGINVSIVLKKLGINSKALGFCAGFTGREICSRLEELGIQEEFIEVKQGISRINIKLRGEQESEINGSGPEIQKEDVKKLFRQLDDLQDDDVLVLAGSVPSTLPQSIYRDMLEYVSGKRLKIIIDATKDLLVNVLSYHPFLIKPNHHELAEIFGVEIQEKKDVIFYGKRLQEMGARNVLVSMAGEGAVLLTEEGNVYEGTAPKGNVINSVGAGDSMVAGFLAGYLQSKEMKEAFFMGICTGSASAFSENLATKEEVEEIRKKYIF